MAATPMTKTVILLYGGYTNDQVPLGKTHMEHTVLEWNQAQQTSPHTPLHDVGRRKCDGMM